MSKIDSEMEARIKSRLGYVESAHPGEVLKGARIAAKIIEEELLKFFVLKRDNLAQGSANLTQSGQ